MPMDVIWGEVLVHRLALQDTCERFICTHPEAANQAGADKYLWHLVYYDTIVECRKRLRLHTPLHNLSRTSSISGSSECISFEGSQVRSSRSASVSDGVLEEWRREWWSMTLQTLFREALGYLQGLFGQIAQCLDMTSLGYALDIIGQPQSTPVPAAFWIARRVYMYVGDVYRYQYMYLPLLTYSDIGPVDAESIHNLARWTYTRGRALFVDNGRACAQLALLTAHAQNRFESVFWQMCSLCYDDKLVHQHKRGLHRLEASSGDSESEDLIESTVVELVQAVLSRRERVEVVRLYHEVLAVLEEDLEDGRGAIEELEVSGDYCAREYQLSVIIAALLTVSTFIDNDAEIHASIQHLAVVLLLRQTMVLQNLLVQQQTYINDTNDGEARNPDTIYLLSSIALWTDIWRSNELLKACTRGGPQWPDLQPHMAELFDSLTRMVQSYTDIQINQSATPMHSLANEILPHDISLLGWIPLRSVQQKLQYHANIYEFDNHIFDAPYDHQQLLQNGNGKPGIVRKRRVCGGGWDTDLLSMWHGPQNITRIVCARIQVLVMSVADQHVLSYILWGAGGALNIELSRPLVAAPLESKPNMYPAKPASKEAVDLPLLIPDADTWRGSLPQLQKLRSTHTLVLSSAIRSALDDSSYNDQSVLQLIAGDADRQGGDIVVQEATDTVPWSDADKYLFGLQDEDGASIDEDELPTADDVAVEMRGLLQCALYFAYEKFPGRKVAFVTDDGELAFYALWFGIRSVGIANVE
ncbi:hypothetical protein IWW50_000591 [Coemansia erecta]|nr:hypothetical protein IWW50_000591 [Coemansia erecta]